MPERLNGISSTLSAEALALLLHTLKPAACAGLQALHTGLRRCTQGVERAHLSAEASGPVRCMLEGAILNGAPNQLFLKSQVRYFVCPS